MAAFDNQNPKNETTQTPQTPQISQPPRDPRLIGRNQERRPSQPSSGSDDLFTLLKQYSGQISATAIATTARDRANKRFAIESEELAKAKQRQFQYPSVVARVKHSRKRQEEKIAKMNQKIESQAKRQEETLRALTKTIQSGSDQQQTQMAQTAEINRLKQDVNKQSGMSSTVDTHEEVIKRMDSQISALKEQLNVALESRQSTEKADKTRTLDELSQRIDDLKALVLAPTALVASSPASNSNNDAVETDIKNLSDQLADLRKIEEQKDTHFGNALNELEQRLHVSSTHLGQMGHDVIFSRNAIAYWNSQIPHKLKEIYDNLYKHSGIINNHTALITDLKTQLPNDVLLKATMRKNEELDARMATMGQQLPNGELLNAAIRKTEDLDTRMVKVEQQPRNGESSTVAPRMHEDLDARLSRIEQRSEEIFAKMNVVEQRSDKTFHKVNREEQRGNNILSRVNAMDKKIASETAGTISTAEADHFRDDLDETMERIADVEQTTSTKLAQAIFDASRAQDQIKQITTLQQKLEQMISSQNGAPGRAEPLTPSDEQDHAPVKSESPFVRNRMSNIPNANGKKRKLTHQDRPRS